MSAIDDLSDVPLGAENPDDPGEICVECPDCKKKRFVKKKMRGMGEFKAMGFISRCVSCASRQSQLRRRAALPDIHLLSGSTVRPSVKNPDNENEELVICGICGKEHFDYRRPRHNAKDGFCVAQKGFCDDCWPWARIALRPEHDAGPSAKRDAIYARIKGIRLTLEVSNRRMLKGAQMPFCVLAEEWDERHPQAERGTRDTQSYNIKLLSFHFGTTPIGDINLEAGMEFRRHLLTLPPTRGKGCLTKQRSEAAVNYTLGYL